MKEKRNKIIISNTKHETIETIRPHDLICSNYKIHQFPDTEIFIDKIESKIELQKVISILDEIGRTFQVDYRNFTESLSPLNTNGFICFSSKQTHKPSAQLKRIFDIFSSAAAIMLLSPLLFATALLIKISSSGPIFYKQVRIGLHGKQFTMFKFRSMISNAEKHMDSLKHLNKRDGPTFKIDDDPRVTTIGKILRKHSIDELPQLINILFGDMSIVGPRPPLPEEFEQYSTWQTRRMSVTPGLTCYWQILRNKNIDFSQWVKLDLEYIDGWSFWKDIEIIFKTIPEVIFGRRSN